MLPRVLAVLLALALALAACGGDDGEEEATSAPTASPAPAEEAGCESVEQPEPKRDADVRKPKEQLDPGRTYIATVETSCGSFKIELAAKDAPRTGGSFKALADAGFYDGTTFHRISPGFVIQGGDPLGEGTGGPGYSVVEKPPDDLVYTRGIVAMAKTATDAHGTSGSQFFVVTAEDAQLPPQYALLGEVTEGLDVVDRIATVPTDPATERPNEPVVIESISVEESR
jgi:peptidyl-prolyl cis-trans isomerase B (cyclophilin B)